MKLRVTLLVLAIGSLILVSFMVPLALLLRSFAAEQAVSKATNNAQLLAPLVATLNARELGLAVARVNGQNPAEPITIFLPGGRQLGSPAAMSPSVRQAAAGQSFSPTVPGGINVLVAVQGLPSGGTAVIRAFVPDAVLRNGVAQSWLLLGIVAVGLLGLAAIVAAQLSRSLVRPLAIVAQVSAELAEGHLSARAPADGPPEVRQVSTGLNRLAARIGELLAHERETLADLSHQLRTPLTALRIDAESLRDEEEMTRLIADVDALTSTVNEIIREARRPTADTATATCDAAEVVWERSAYWRALAEDQNRWMSVEITADSVPVRVPADDLATCADILLENVFAHTPEGTAFSVRVTPRPAGGAWLAVSDGGRGFAGAGPTRRGQSGGGSTGLGLDIARRIAERAGGTLTLGRSPHGGAAVTIGLGPPLGRELRPRRPIRSRLLAPRPRRAGSAEPDDGALSERARAARRLSGPHGAAPERAARDSGGRSPLPR